MSYSELHMKKEENYEASWRHFGSQTTHELLPNVQI